MYGLINFLDLIEVLIFKLLSQVAVIVNRIAVPGSRYYSLSLFLFCHHLIKRLLTLLRVIYVINASLSAYAPSRQGIPRHTHSLY